MMLHVPYDSGDIRLTTKAGASIGGYAKICHSNKIDPQCNKKEAQ